jgi:ribonuclease D
MSAPRIISTQSELDAACAAWRQAGTFAFDTEFIRDETFDAILCLIQVADADGVTLVDTMQPMDLAGFWSLVSDPALEKVVHAGKEDFELCLRATGETPHNVFDVQIACGFVGLGYPLSLARVVSGLLNKTLHKGQTMTDWARRPLTPEQLEYAVEDVRHLLAAHAKLRGRLEKYKRLEWAREEFVRFEDREHYRPPIEDRLSRVSGSGKLDALGLAILQRLMEWREKWAMEKNRPVRALVRDDILVEIARRKPTRAGDIEVLRGFPGARSPTIVRIILDLVAEARKSPPASWPEPERHRELSAVERAVQDMMVALTRWYCYENDVAYELTATTPRLRELLDHLSGEAQETPQLLTGWRAEFIGRRIEGVLRGRSEIHIGSWPKTPRIDVVLHDA